LLPSGVLEEDVTVALNATINSIRVSIITRDSELSTATVASITETFVEDLSVLTETTLALDEAARVVSTRTVAYPHPPPSTAPLPTDTTAAAQLTDRSGSSSVSSALPIALVVVVAVLLSALFFVVRRLRHVEQAVQQTATQQQAGMHRTMRSVLAVKRQLNFQRAAIEPANLQQAAQAAAQTPDVVSPEAAWLHREETTMAGADRMDALTALPNKMTTEAMEIEIQEYRTAHHQTHPAPSVYGDGTHGAAWASRLPRRDTPRPAIGGRSNQHNDPTCTACRI